MTDDILKSKAEITVAQLEAEGSVERFCPSIFYDNKDLEDELFKLRIMQAENVRQIQKDNNVYGPNGQLKP